MKKEETVLGIVHAIPTDEQFYSWGNAPAYLNKKIISVSNTTDLKDALIATGFPYEYFGKLPKYINLLGQVIKNSRGMRRLGSAALDLAYVACGRFDGFFEYNLNSWDVAAGAFLVKQAGGNVSDFKNGNQYIHGKEIIAGTTGVQEALYQLAKDNFF